MAAHPPGATRKRAPLASYQPHHSLVMAAELPAVNTVESPAATRACVTRQPPRARRNSACALAQGCASSGRKEEGGKLAKELVSACVVICSGQCMSPRDWRVQKAPASFFRREWYLIREVGVVFRDACAVLLQLGVGRAQSGGIGRRGLRGACAEAVGGRPDSPLFGFAILRGSGSGGGSGGWSL